MIGICSQGPNWQQINIDLDFGLLLYWCIWINVDIAYLI